MFENFKLKKAFKRVDEIETAFNPKNYSNNEDLEYHAKNVDDIYGISCYDNPENITISYESFYSFFCGDNSNIHIGNTELKRTKIADTNDIKLYKFSGHYVGESNYYKIYYDSENNRFYKFYTNRIDYVLTSILDDFISKFEKKASFISPDTFTFIITFKDIAYTGENKILFTGKYLGNSKLDSKQIKNWRYFISDKTLVHIRNDRVKKIEIQKNDKDKKYIFSNVNELDNFFNKVKNKKDLEPFVFNAYNRYISKKEFDCDEKQYYGGLTGSFTCDFNENVVFCGISYCSENDQFNKMTGRELSTKKMKEVKEEYFKNRNENIRNYNNNNMIISFTISIKDFTRSLLASKGEEYVYEWIKNFNDIQKHTLIDAYIRRNSTVASLIFNLTNHFNTKKYPNENSYINNDLNFIP